MKRFYLPLFAISLLTLIIALAAVLRAWQANESLWIDELHTSWVVSDDADFIAGRAAIGNQSPLFFYVVKASTFCFGMTELALRLPSLIAGTALVLLVFFACARWTKSTCAGLFAAVVVALERDFLFYSQEARPYAMVQLVGLIQIMLFVELVSRARQPDSRKHGRFLIRIALVISTACLFYLHYTAMLIVVGEVAAFAVLRIATTKPGTYQWSTFSVDLGITCLLCLPAAGHLWDIWQRKQNWLSIPADWPSLETARTVAVFVVLPLLVVATAWISKTGRRDGAPWRFVGLLAMLFAIPLLIGWLLTVTGIANLGLHRYVIVTAVIPMIFAACCCGLLARPVVRIAAGLLIAICAITSDAYLNRETVFWQLYEPEKAARFHYEDWRGAVRWINEPRSGHQVPVLLCSALVEDESLWKTTDAKTYEYLQFPLRGIYRLNPERRQVIPLPTFPHPTNQRRQRPSSDKCREIGRAGGAWLVIRHDRPKEWASITEDILHSLRESGLQARGVSAHSFGNVRVVRLEAFVPTE